MWWVAVSLAGDLESPTQLWAGHQVTVTSRNIPLIGTVETRQDVWMLARVLDTGDQVTLVETPCRIDIQSDARVKLSFAPEAVQRIPPATLVYTAGPEGLTGQWTGGWDQVDVDGDGKAGFLVRVEAPICGGSMSVATRTTTSGRAVRAGGGLEGTVSIALERDVLSASNPCLGLVPRHTSEALNGVFAYRPVEAGATCASLLGGEWPVRARQ